MGVFGLYRQQGIRVQVLLQAVVRWLGTRETVVPSPRTRRISIFRRVNRGARFTQIAPIFGLVKSFARFSERFLPIPSEKKSSRQIGVKDSDFSLDLPTITPGLRVGLKTQK